MDRCKSPENSGIMDYGAECRIHGYNGEAPMFSGLKMIYFFTKRQTVVHLVGELDLKVWHINIVLNVENV